jgi:hypothetical protein
MADEKQSQSSLSRRSSDLDNDRRALVVEVIAASFECDSISKPPRVIEHGEELHVDSTTFASSGLDQYYKPSSQWEGLHRYDTEFTWKSEEEKSLIRKVWVISSGCSHHSTMSDRIRLTGGSVHSPV